MTFQHVHKGQPFYETADFRNAVVDLLRRDFAARKAVSSISGIAGREGIGHYRHIHIYAETALTSRAIFTIRSYGTYFGQMYPTAASIQVKTTTPPDAVYVVVDDHGLGAGAEGMCEIVGDEKAHMVYYDSADGTPVLGGIVGVKPDTYKVSTKYSGLNVVSEPDTINKLVWVTRNYFYEFVKAKANECHYPGIDVNNGHRLYTYNSTACEWQDQYTLDITVKDPQGLVMMLPDEIHWAIKHRCGTDEVQYEFLNEFGLIRLALTTEEIGISSSGGAILLGGEIGSGSGIGDCPVTIWNIICDMEIPGYTYVYVKYFPERAQWEIISTCSAANGIVLVRANNCLYPGGSTYANVYNMVAGTPVDLGVTILLDDFDYDNCLLPGEYTWAVKDLTSESYYPVGSKGLKRTGVIAGSGGALHDICDELTVNIYTRESDEAVDCEGTASGCSVSVCPPYVTWDRKWESGEYVSIWFDKGQRKWYLTQNARAHFCRTLLHDNMCWDQAATVEANPMGAEVWFLDKAKDCVYNPGLGGSTATASNPFHHQGHAGDRVLLLWDDRYEEWTVIDVEKHPYVQPVTDAVNSPFLRLDFCTSIEGQVLPVVLETCEIPEWQPQISLEETNIVEAVEYVGSGNCGALRVTTNSVCGFGSGGEGQEQDVLTFEEVEALIDISYSGSTESYPGSGSAGDIVCGSLIYNKRSFCAVNLGEPSEHNLMNFRAINVVVDISDDGTCVYATYQAICVADYDEDEVALPIICCQDCESGSTGS